MIPVLGSQPAGDVSRKPGGRLPLLFARLAVTPTTFKRAATMGTICTMGVNSLPKTAVGAFLQATSRVPRWWIGERPPDMAASCDIYK